MRQQIEAVLKEDYVVENPVTRSRGLIQLREDATPQIRLIMDEMGDLGKRMSEIEMLFRNKIASMLVAQFTGFVGNSRHEPWLEERRESAGTVFYTSDSNQPTHTVNTAVMSTTRVSRFKRE